MCDYSLTDNPAESDVPTEAEPWEPVDLTDVEDKMRKLSTTPVEAKAEAPPSPPAPQEEVDFGSEPEELLLKGPLVSTASALPTSTPSVQDSTSGAASASKEALQEESKDSTSVDASASKEALPEKSNPQPKGPPEVKAPPSAKAPPAGARHRWRI